ncbi:glycoside hydrolase family 2 [Treponema parvum]|uniref:Beta-glucuronidase n=1 Tax=Treponema parvum TaxID=138851 RepID=A0A975EY23_9SPIR|nr:glycoside hydrolase family 2 TIM barrel-domain containing protein [Treponema parvum]QTQ10958.1 glycoside hydrolase family 2 [Treponema parvum]
MEKKSGNFESSIHEKDYRSKFLPFVKTAKDALCIDGRDLESLNGEWNFTADPYESALRGQWYEEKRFSEDGRELPCDFDFQVCPLIDVPSCWNMTSPELFYYEGMGVYYREFTYAEKKAGERTFIQFEGAQYRTYVFLNNKPVALHDGGSTPFTVETTGLLQRFNKIMVFVDAARDDSRVPMSNTDWFNYGGLYRDVYFVRTPKVLIKDWFVRLVPGSGYKKIALDFQIDGAKTGKAEFCIPELDIKKEVSVSNGKGSLEISASPELWSPENPKLYDVSLSFEDDEISDKIGFREIKVEKMKVYLNGKARYLKGVCVHEDHETLGKTTNDDEIRATIQNLKDMNGVFLRLAHYPHTRRFAKIADEAGVMLWEEVPVYWAIDFTNPATYKDAENQLTELIVRDKNRASVIIWSVGNENADTDDRLKFMSDLAHTAKRLDNTRLVSAACLVNRAKMRLEDRLMDELDIIGNNEYYGWYEPNFDDLITVLNNTNLTKPVVITEFGAGAKYGNHGTADTMWTEEYQEALYKKQFETMKKIPFIQGTTPWILYDFRAVRRQNRYQRGFNRKGLIDADRKRRKLAFKVVADYYAELD